ncbi:MAG: tyrosine-type recombinase/integrase [Alphaproteobacteria bacterium]|nr:tyrosine-type recombinase/integrase [Alphaproteobacteria bacterium]MBV9378170.1 tyrosine-type recombinase/integrase [Alphaproteobacteria bacterium]
MPKLTKRTVDAIRPDPHGREAFVWDTGDGALKGFGVRMMPSGIASYLVQYRTKEGRTRRLVIGKLGVLTPDEARKLASDKLKEVATGGDPSAERHRVRREALIIAQLADLYLADGPAAKPNKKASSWTTDRSNIERHVKPLLGRKLAASLTHDDVVRFQRDVAAGKSKADVKTRKRGRAIVDGGPGTAARSLAVLGAMLEWAAHPERKLIPANPAKGVKLLQGRKQERFLSEAELARLADALTAMEGEHRLSPTATAAIRLLLLSGCRKAEILSLRWDWVDVERGLLRLPDSKTGAKLVPLAAAAVKLLAELPRGGDYVLPAAKGAGHYTGLQKDWERVRARAELAGARIHDLRHSFASFAVADGNSLYLIGKVLGHKQARTTEIYAHLADDPVRAVADRTAARIAAAMSGTTGRSDAAKVVPIRGSRS